MPKSRAQQQWVKNHPMEGDGLVTGFFNFLHKRDTKTMKTCKDVLIPDTIVFDHNFPRGWYTTDLKAHEISKRQGKELDAASIYNAFSKTPNNAVAAVASYMSAIEEEDEEGNTVSVTQVEYFNEDSLREFVGRKVKRQGILQKFLIPKGHRNSVIQAVWSPRLCLVQRRTNVGSIRDKLQCERDPYPVCITYEGPSHLSEEGTCAGHTTEEIKDICGSIVRHFFAVEHKYITRMVVYFKVDEKDQVWLLWCGSLRVSDRDTPSHVPLDLAPKFTSPSLQQSNSPQKDEKMLYEADMKHLGMTNDTLFYTTFVKPTEDEMTRKEEGHQSGEDENSTNDRNKGDRRKDRKEKKNDEGDSSKKDDEDWHTQPGIQDQYRELCLDRESVLNAMDDIFYEAYGHFLKYNPGPFYFEVERKIAQTLGVDVLQELMQSVKIEHSVPSEESGTTVEDEELSFVIPPFHAHGPVTKLGEAVRVWVTDHYDKREAELKEEAVANQQATAEEPEEEKHEQPEEEKKEEEPV